MRTKDVKISHECHALIQKIGRTERRGISDTVEHVIESYARIQGILRPSKPKKVPEMPPIVSVEDAGMESF